MPDFSYQSIVYKTQAQIDAGLTDVPNGVSVVIVNTSGVVVGDGGMKVGEVVVPVTGVKNNLAATVAPVVANDSSQGYAVGSRWIDVTNDESYIATGVAVGAAEWSRTTVGTIAEVAGLQTALDAKEVIANKRTTFQSIPTDTAYPSEKLTKDGLDTKFTQGVSVAMSAGYPTATVARSFTLTGKTFSIAQLAETVFSGVDLNGSSILDTATGQYIQNTLNTSVANEVSCWFGVFETPYTKCVKVKFVNNGSNVDITATETAHWNTDVLTDSGWTITGGVPASRQSTGVPASSNAATGYGLEALTVLFAPVTTTKEIGLMSVTDKRRIDGFTSDLDLKAPLASPALTGVPTAPTASAGTSTTQLASTAFVTDSVIASQAGLDFKASVVTATTANITLSGTQAIDGVAVVAGNRVLVKNQTTASQNGIYDVAAGAWTRSSDANANNEVSAGMYAFVEGGTVNSGKSFVLTTTGNIVLGTTALSFSEFPNTSGKEDTSNKVTAFLSPTDTQYPSAKLTNDQLLLKQNISEKAQANGYASLGADSRVPAAQLPVSDSKLTYSDTDVSGNATVDAIAAVTQPTLTVASSVMNTSAFVSTISETHASTKWDDGTGALGTADATNKTSKTYGSNAFNPGNLSIRAAHVDSNSNQSQRSTVVVMRNRYNLAQTWADNAYPTATTARTIGTKAVETIATLDAVDALVSYELGGGYMGTGNTNTVPSATALASARNTWRTDIANEITFWALALDGLHTKAVKVKLTNHATAGINVNVIQSVYWDSTDVTASASWTTTTIPASSIAAEVSSGESANGYGLELMTLKLG